LTGCYLLTGAHGFVGANFLRALVELGKTCHIIVEKTSNLYRIRDLLKSNLLKLHIGDMSEIKWIEDLVREIQPTFVIHLATKGAYFYQIDHDVIEKSNIQCSLNLIKANLTNKKLKLFLNIGSSVQYDQSSTSSLKEDSFLRPLNTYSLTKSWIANYGFKLFHEKKFPFATAILFSVYGEYEDHTRLIPTVITRLMNNLPLNLHNPNYTRDFIYVADVIADLLAILNNPSSCIGQNYNIGTSYQYKIDEIVKILLKIFNKKVDVSYTENISRKIFEPKTWQADISKITPLRKLKPKIIEEGLKLTVEWFIKNKQLYPNYSKLESLSRSIRINILKTAFLKKSSHIGSCFSIVELLVYIYFVKIKESKPNSHLSDKFIFSKGHAAMALYAVLFEKNFISLDQYNSYLDDGSMLGGHPYRDLDLGIEMTSGSLGQGLSVGAGIAIALKRKNKNKKIIVLISDGELAEGSTLEALQFITHHKLNNLIVVIDRNKFYSLDATESILSLEPIDKKLMQFGFFTVNINGHSYEEIDMAFKTKANSPVAIVANTVKGKGIDYMEEDFSWHFRSPNEQEYKKALNQLEKKNL